MPIFGLDPFSLVLALALFLVFWAVGQGQGKAGLINKLPGPMAYPVLGNVVEMFEPRDKVLENIMKRHYKYGKIFRVWAGSRPFVIFSDPDYIEILLKSSKHSEKSFFYNYLHSWLGTGLLTSYGKKWALHRKLITPTFHFKVLQSFVDVFNGNASILVNKLKAKADTGEKVDIHSLVTLCTLDIICETAMGTKVNAQKESHNEYVESVYKLSELVIHRQIRPWLHPQWVFERSTCGKEFKKHLSRVHGFTNSVIQSRKEALKQKNSKTADEEVNGQKLTFLDLLLESSTQGGSSLLTDEELREEVDTFMFEGHDTTAAGLSWALSILGRHPQLQEDCYEEIKTIFENDPDRMPTLPDLTEMKLLERVIKEALRLYPSVTNIGRVLEEDVQFGEYLVPKGTDALISIYSMHREPSLYPEPEKFDPNRFLPENSTKRHPYSYIPFSAGPRNCIGQKFALFEEKAILSTLIRNFRFESMEAPEDTAKIPNLVLRPKSCIWMKVSRR